MLIDPGRLARNQRALHQIPETGYQEFKTREYLFTQLKALKPDGLYDMNRTGIKAVFLAPGGAHTLGFRADMDALSIKEHTGLDYASTHPGVMHACGHDAHMAIALETATVAAQLRDEGLLKVNAVFLFQPAEESLGGAQPMVKAGALENPHVDEVYALHVMPHIPLGKMGLRAGPAMAATTEFDLELTGRASHGASPQAGADALAAATHLYGLIQTLLSRRIDPTQGVLMTIGRLTAGDRRNIIAREARLEGILRTFYDQSMMMALDVMTQAAQSVQAAFGLEGATLIPTAQYPVVNNDPKVTQGLFKLLGDKAIPADPLMAAEDFSYFLRERPGAMMFLGLGGGAPLHSDGLIIPEAALLHGAETMVSILTKEMLF